jgi:hypothetical protein
MSQNFDWTLLSFQPIDCRPLESISAYSGIFAPTFAPSFAPGNELPLNRWEKRCRSALKPFGTPALRIEDSETSRGVMVLGILYTKLVGHLLQAAHE